MSGRVLEARIAEERAGRISQALRRPLAAWRRLPQRWRRLVQLIALWGGLSLIERVLHLSLASSSLVASLLAPSSASQLPALTLAVVFVSLRVLVLAFMPAYIVARGVLALLDSTSREAPTRVQ